MIRRSIPLLLIVSTLVGLFTAPAARAVTPAEVSKSIDHAKDYLWSQQKKDGTWELVPQRNPQKPGWEWEQDMSGGQWGGMTALAILALVSAGEDPQSDKLAPAIEFLKKADLIGTYALCMRCQVLVQLPDTPDNKALLRKDVLKLLGMMRKNGPARGFYGYVGTGENWSLMASQYGVLGVWAAAAQAGVYVPGNYWTEIERAWNAAQEADGGWRYQPKRQHPPVTAGVTAVGVGTMFMVQDQLYGGRGVDCTKSSEMPAIEKGIDWITKHFDRVAPEQKMEREFPNINLYAVERIGAAGGLKYFGDKDWYAHGTDFLLRRQRKDGSWGGGLSYFSDTSYGLMFLANGRAPVIFNKLNYGDEDKSAGGPWNRRPRDVANLTRWMAKTGERELNWQIVNLDSPIADWHDAPVMYLSGSEPPKLSKESVAKLKRYVEEGGLLLANADCGKTAFNASMRNLAAEMFPGMEFRELPDAHPIYSTVYSRAKWKTKPSVMGISNGVRELMLLIPQADAGKAWQVGTTRGVEELWQLAANVLYYAADARSLEFKGETHQFVEDPSVKPVASIKVARMRYKGNWDPEPGGWRRVRNLLRNNDRLDVIVEPVELGNGELEGFKVAHLTGTAKFKPDPVQKGQLRRFVAGGGTLIIDAAGGSEAFASAIEPELESIGTGATLDTLPPDHSLFGGREGVRARYRTPAGAGAAAAADKRVKGGAPRIKAVRVGDRAAILYSREDLSAGLVGNPVAGVTGYHPATATEIVRRIILRAADIDPAKAKAKPAADDTGLD